MAKYGGRMVSNLRRMVWDNYPHNCHWCKRSLSFHSFTVEHLLPRSKGGTHQLANLRPACGSRKSGGCGENFSRGNGQRKSRAKLIDNTSFFKN